MSKVFFCALTSVMLIGFVVQADESGKQVSPATPSSKGTSSDSDSGSRGVTNANQPNAKLPPGRHYLVLFKVIEVDEDGNETVLTAPRLIMQSGTAGARIEERDGRRIDLSVKITQADESDPEKPDHDKADPPKGTAPPKLLSSTEPADSVDSVDQRLSRRVNLKVDRIPRREALRNLARSANINIALDPESTKLLADQLDERVSLNVQDESVRRIIERLVNPLKLGFTIKHDVVLVANAEKLLPEPEEISVRVYSVADLVAAKDDADQADLGPLVKQIKATVLPDSWDRKGSPVAIQAFESTSSLVVRQTVEGHGELTKALQKLRGNRPKALAE